MPHYRVCFYKALVSSNGHPAKCLQAEIDVRDAEGAAQAAEAASRTFEILHGLRDWKLHADAVEVVTISSSKRARPTTGTRKGDAESTSAAKPARRRARS